MNAAAALLMFYSVLFPAKTWYAPHEPINVAVKAPGAGDVRIVLTDFTNRALDELKQELIVSGEKTLDVKTLLPEGTAGGTYLLYAVPKDSPRKDFVGTPLVITIRQDKRQGAPPGPMSIKVEPLCFVRMTTDKGPMTMVFYWDVAPNTTANFIALAGGGFYDGLTFHRVVPDFVIQGGDPRGDGSGGPGYMIDAEFNTRQHIPGVLSMARSGDPNEAGGAMPRAEFANSAGSQFFICLDYQNTQQLDRRYTAFGKVVEGMETVRSIAGSKIADLALGRPEAPVTILKAEVMPVTAGDNPYMKVFEEVAGPTLLPKDLGTPANESATQPASQPAAP
jgi:cyclophilin family peptidyl-prolyl cis-trans isomerase